MQAIIFDLDGTIYQTEKVAVPAFRATFEWLKDQGLYQGKIPADQVFEQQFGLTGAEFWSRLLPDANEEVRQLADQQLLKEEIKWINQGAGACYPGVVETLNKLKDQGYQLLIASNGLEAYVEHVLHSEEILSLFTGIYTASRYQTTSKTELVKRCLDDHHIQSGMMVGDRRSDIVAGKENYLLSIGCRYTGFRSFSALDELEQADHLIYEFPELLHVLERN
ncbi:adenosylhomocysteine nucleosidase [Seinonella peptonophila]|uniref:Adenosylhomocysteine nucleosidase n=1 Tax=Seinonella peptonophila TaxID=112248 RepID=A0A1M4YTE3_9BACL|nr:HAD hydrolase-like protein [Seinonella peptonophila]SHF09003.1 adenosylhomocysteine nucleosidase [Seinonella peptonophila]